MTSSFAPFSDLSQELIDEIIDALFDNHDTDKREFDLATSELSPREMSDFCACALVCRSFRHRSQKHIFSSMTVLGIRSTEFDHWGRVDDLCEILQANPRVACHVRRLCFNMDNTTQWLVENPDFLHLMEGITRDSDWAVGMKLELAIFAWSTEFQEFKDDKLETNFFRTSSTSFITSLKLFHVQNVPVTLLAHFPHLVELELNNATLKAVRRRPAIVVDHSLRPRLQKFKIRWQDARDDTIPGLATTFVNFSYLRRFYLGDADLSRKLPGIICILDASSRSLEYLHISFKRLRGRLSDVYDLSKFPNLSFLSLLVELKMTDAEGQLTDLCQMLRTIPSHKNKIKTVVVYFTAYLQPPWSISACLDRSDWGFLALALAKIAERERLVIKFKFDITEEFYTRVGEGMKVNGTLDELDGEMRCWIADNRELMTKLSSNVSPEYEYKFICKELRFQKGCRLFFALE
ncbi:hypothetical protein GALMADRAFT_559506 [Galerina marginata CBS 339.88]|uniref:F-box domain-containing protein n=1 Tax=Galerina marginata (strain CBS 339.88) TaxID=685588 RepID=A0A067SX58_GALM3|nr:hypothetical protein GALMADRAFT_559506 [Galerina marginata CBS 339.88]